MRQHHLIGFLRAERFLNPFHCSRRQRLRRLPGDRAVVGMVVYLRSLSRLGIFHRQSHEMNTVRLHTRMYR